MSWIKDIADLFSRDETEKAISEARLKAEAEVEIKSKMRKFRDSYSKITDSTTRRCANRLLNKIGFEMPEVQTQDEIDSAVEDCTNRFLKKMGIETPEDQTK
jgi:hypothetical protein